MKTRIIISAAIAALTLTGCGKEKTFPANFEVIGKTGISGDNLLTLRDTGTGCEWVYQPSGILSPRNERSADGNTVKQRCVPLGGEQAAVVTTTVRTAPPAAAGFGSSSPSQEDAVRDAVRSQSMTSPVAPEIPPPTGMPDDGVESQMKNP